MNHMLDSSRKSMTQIEYLVCLSEVNTLELCWQLEEMCSPRLEHR